MEDAFRADLRYGVIGVGIGELLHDSIQFLVQESLLSGCPASLFDFLGHQGLLYVVDILVHDSIRLVLLQGH